ncbi:Na-H-Exchanger domain-containing protein [Fusarium falciforme]|uniref:Na-H-Exchanger domain-containing protein n=1 Tax=Fusarium falciforme TaxID=195108 RepID=UPI002300A6D6|nr:Na-H-Exchanger domain-containing protein [Fusarium falciforme]WAO94917.1 Na-H-Exchanger domain-containing protein [Fusarium falciforme]
MESSLSYHEPSITVISILSGFLLLLNLLNYGLDKIAYCGLIGQVALGIAWGTPGAKWLSREVEDAVMQLGYLGLILIVYEGGLATSFKSLKANIGLSSGVAITGILLPIGLSFALKSMFNASLLQAFAAGAALCSTSLGTTFTILGTSGLSTTRLGVVLTSAAMMDDVVGLIMVQVISNLGGDSFDAITVVRPVMVSLAFAALMPLLGRFVVMSVTAKLNTFREAHPSGKVAQLLRLRQTAFVIHTALLLGLVVGATFAGTSSLLAAYIAGATISWWDSEVLHVPERVPSTSPGAEITEERNQSSDNTTTDQAAPAISEQTSLPLAMGGGSGMDVYERYYKTAVEHILKPFFFASIGFSVPITRLFSGPIAWRGIIYTILMTISKLACGIWLVSFANPLRPFQKIAQRLAVMCKQNPKPLVPGAQCADPDLARQDRATTSDPTEEREAVPLGALGDTSARPVSPELRNSTPKPEKAVSLYPACIVGLGMVARGEIGFLIAALAESKGVFGRPPNGQPSELFLIVTWAISLCTVIGPICVGLLVNRVKQLEAGSLKKRGEGKRNVLGAWGVS